MYVSLLVARSFFLEKDSVDLLQSSLTKQFIASVALNELDYIRTFDEEVEGYVNCCLRHRVTALVDDPNIVVLELFTPFLMPPPFHVPQEQVGPYVVGMLNWEQFFRMQEICINLFGRLLQYTSLFQHRG